MNKTITLGLSGSTPVTIDLAILIRTRLLIQANSGGGKSFALRRLIEQAYGKVQIIVIDYAGEFASLREKYDFVLVGRDGDTPADVRSAGLLATRLLELGASCVCDLYSLKPADRHVWVRNFFESVMNAEKKLWHPVLFVVDEAHKFCPEKGEGESEAKGVILSLCADGRKYGFCAVLATQRLAKLDKSGAAELLNVLIGPTFIDLDLERAHKALGIVRRDWAAFDEQMKTVEPGNFWALGRAITTHRTLVRIGGVQTTHPEPGMSVYIAPPPPDKIKSLLPKLADLPVEMERKLKTESDLRLEITRLKHELSARPVEIKQLAGATKIERVEVPVLPDSQYLSLLDVFQKAEKKAEQIHKQQEELHQSAMSAFETMLADIRKPAESLREIRKTLDGIHKTPVVKPTVYVQQSAVRKSTYTPQAEYKAGPIAAPRQRILDALSWMESVGLNEPKRKVIAFLSQQSSKSSGYTNNLSALRTEGLITYPSSDSVALTDAGRQVSNTPPALLDSATLQSAILARLPRPQARILEVLIEAGGQPVERAELAERAGQSVTSSGYTNNLSALRSFGLIDYPNPQTAAATGVLWI